MNLTLGYRNVVTGLEGCGKSSRIFEQLKETATPDNPILFGVKNYNLMKEQIDNWSTRYKVPKIEFAICGYSTGYEVAMEAYTNKEMPYLVGDEVRFVFCTQAQIQRNLHKKFKTTKGQDVVWSHIIIDEFDFINGIIPTLDFYFSRIRDLEGVKNLELKKYQWILKNYTLDDVSTLQFKQKIHNEGFTVAYWIKDTHCPLTFLTSEILSKELLLSLPTEELLSETFKEIYVDSPDFKDCIVHTFTYEHVNKFFFEQFNRNYVWDQLDFDYIISDNLLSWYDKNADKYSLVLEKTVVPHLGARGSNLFRDSKVLTVLSHIPKRKIKEIYETFKYFEKEMEYMEIENLFYRDRLCQAVGRVLGNRGSKETHLIIHSQLHNLIASNLHTFPYTFKTDWTPEFKDSEEIFNAIEEAKTNSLEIERQSRANYQAISFSLLEDYFQYNPNSVIPVKDFKEFIKVNNLKGLSQKSTNFISATKVAKYFNQKYKLPDVLVKNIRVKDLKKTCTCVIGLEFKNV
jgi:hypothetical protein